MSPAPGAVSIAMTNILISRWARKRADRPRFYVTDGREPLGVIFESRGIFTAVDRDGRLVTASTAFQTAANALVLGTGASS
jgi:hypothetical protein